MKNKIVALYVEDDETVRENFTQILENYFAKLIVAEDGITALQLYQQYQPQVAILDISIPKLNGLQLANKIRQENDDIQIIMLTAYSEQDKLLQAVNLQLFAYLIKPVLQNDLDSTLNKLIKKIKSNNVLPLAYGYYWHKEEENLYFENKLIKLSHNERLILDRMCRHPNRYYTADELSECFNKEPDSSSDTAQYWSVVQIISRLKRKLLTRYKSDGFFIENVYRSGYKIISII